VRVSEFGGHVELEILVVLDQTVTELKSQGVTFLDHSLLQEWFNCGVQLLLDVLDQDWVSHLDGSLQELKVLLFTELENLDT